MEELTERTFSDKADTRTVFFLAFGNPISSAILRTSVLHMSPTGNMAFESWY